MRYWLMKSEPSECSIDMLSTYENQTVEWFGIRNYQARNFMRDQMQVGDLALFWHSSCKEPGVYGVVKIISAAHADTTQFDINSHYYDPKSTIDKPRWCCVDVQLVKKTIYVPISTLRDNESLSAMQVLQRGNRLSITSVTEDEWNVISELL